MQSVATALKAAEGVEFKCDEAKLQALKSSRLEEKQKLKSLSSKVKLEERKRKRLMDKCGKLATNDLLECFRYRFDNLDKKEQACARRQKRQAEAEAEAQGQS